MTSSLPGIPPPSSGGHNGHPTQHQLRLIQEDMLSSAKPGGAMAIGPPGHCAKPRLGVPLVSKSLSPWARLACEGSLQGPLVQGEYP